METKIDYIKLICIDKANFINLTEGKVYTGYYEKTTNDGICWIIDHDDYSESNSWFNRRGFQAWQFITLAEWRERQINSILND